MRLGRVSRGRPGRAAGKGEGTHCPLLQHGEQAFCELLALVRAEAGDRERPAGKAVCLELAVDVVEGGA